jgi:hypothetical protein
MGRFPKFTRYAMKAAILAALLLLSTAGWIWIAMGSFGACVLGTTGNEYQNAVNALSGTIDLGSTLSVTLVGVASAGLLGWKTDLRLTERLKTVMLAAAVLFGQSAIAGTYWKLQLANGWLNQCLNLIYEPSMQRSFTASLVFFGSGIACAMILLIVAALTPGKDNESA